MVKFVDTNGDDVAVNPNYVTSVRRAGYAGRKVSEMWVIGAAGYQTFAVYLDESIDDVRKRLEECA
jgi:hypothetical protein